MSLPTRILYTEDPPSKVINENALSGSESVLIELKTYLDVHSGPGVFPVDVFFEKSEFLSILQTILTTIRSDLDGPMSQLWKEIVDHGAELFVKKHIKESDYSDLITISCIEPVTGIYTVSAKIEGETKVSNLRALDKMTLDKLFIEVVTDYFLIQSIGDSSESTL